ncbi:MAG: bile acid:sodium symporter family protein [Anaerobacillus sp.]|uniref:bile acid:sodium symporter family protein n=1 Tax=Anaerobacillus sp. TaxID=1872506 RepID=UPI00391998DB
MMQQINRMLEKRLPLLTPICVVSGITIFSFLHSYAFLVPWIFAFMTFSSSLGLKIRDIGRSLKSPIPLLVCLLILQFIMPLLAFFTGKVFFANNIDLITGLVLAFAIPTGIVSLMWVAIHKGSSVISLTIILVSTLLSPFLVPLTLKLLLGAEVSLDTLGLMSGLFWMIVVPSLLGIFLNHYFQQPCEKLKPQLAPFAKIGLLLVILINSSVVSPYFTKIDAQLVKLLIVLISLALTGYAIGIVAGRLFNWNNEIVISLAYNSGIRNNGVGAALAITYFAPQVTLPIILTILFQQVLAAVVGKHLKRFLKQEKQLLNVSNL